MPVWVPLFVINFIAGSLWMLFEFEFWRSLKRTDEALYQRMGFPRNLYLDISLWTMGRTFLFLLRRRHLQLPQQSLRVIGTIVFWSQVIFVLTFLLFFVIPQDAWL